MAIFAPWAFGTTEPWSIQVMNIAAFVVGSLFLAKWGIRWTTGYRPIRWDDIEPGPETGAPDGGRPPGLSRLRSESAAVWLTRALAVLTVAILAYCLVSALNARSVYHAADWQFEYRNHISWLPHSYDRAATWHWFWNYLALACVFWSLRDWILVRTEREVMAGESSKGRRGGRGNQTVLPARLRRLLWVICINGALVGLQGLLQRLDGSRELLWLVEPSVNKEPEAFFGPYAYRGNAAQFFNLIWPVALGFWWVLRRTARGHNRSRGGHHLLLTCVLIMAACPIVSASRGGAVIAAGAFAASILILLAAEWRSSWSIKCGIVAFLVLAAGVGLFLGGETLGKRMSEVRGGLEVRENIYETARSMTADYPLFGIGPGAFDAVFQLYRSSPDEYWPAQLHHDWLETRITFGRLGSAMVWLALALVVARWFFGGGNIPAHSAFAAFLWVALGGALVHARYDFPFQIYSILLMFVMTCAILFSLRPSYNGRHR